MASYDGPLMLSFYYNVASQNNGDTEVSDHATFYVNGEALSVDLTDPPGGSYTETGWQEFTTELDAGSVGIQIAFALWNDESVGGSSQQDAMVLLDDVRVTAPTAVPDACATGPLSAVAIAALAAGFRLRPRRG